MTDIGLSSIYRSKKRQYGIVQVYTFVAWLYLIVFVPIYLIYVKNDILTYVHLIDLLVLIWVQWRLLRKSSIRLITFALSVIAGLTVATLIYTGGVDNSGILIAFPYVPFIVFMTGLGFAYFWIIGMLFYMFILLMLQTNGTILLPYDQTSFAIFVFAYFLTILLTFAFVREKNYSEKQLDTNTAELEQANKKLSVLAHQQTQAIVKANAILRSIGEGVIVFDAKGRVEQCNEMATKMLGYTENQLKEGVYVDLVKALDESGKEIASEKRPLNLAISSKKTISTTNDYTRKNGKTFTAQLSVAPIIMDGDVVGAIEVFRDMYSEKEIDRSKTEFVSLASHQLRTPLSTISWYAEMLLAGDAGKISNEQTKYVEEIYSSNRRMTELVSSLLNVSRIELGTFSVDPEPTDLVKLAQTTIKDLEPQIFARKLDFQEKYGSDIPITDVDPKLMRIIFENLSSNAIKYTPVGGTIVFKLELKKHNIEVTVKDNGLGIPDAQQKLIFSKLFRADNAKTQDTEGTGLGLYLVKSIVNYAGGKIQFHSVENKGTTFFVTLPDTGMKQKTGTKQLG